MLVDVGELMWSITTVGTVSASPERVRVWWMHPDRKDDLRDRIQRTGVHGFSQTISTVEGVGVRVTKWRDRRRWVHETRVETPLDPDGKPHLNDDGSFPLSQKAILTAPLGYKMTFTCTGKLEFNELDTGSTEVIVIHNHKAVGGTWFNRRNLRRSDEEREPRDFQELIDRCRAELTPSMA
jgi:hypothetical protein